ncbi:MAG: RNA polymerase sporulation sigma factor SigK [Clostridia bacterium]|nr:RNA polymerase sporulation sigma factor SigK [Clostridia bacterium]
MNGILKLFLSFISLVLGLDQPESFPPPLDKEEEAGMFERLRSGDKAARDILIERNLRLVSHIIRKYYSSYSSPDELLSVGCLGLIKAVDSFKSEKGTRFATYGARCVQNETLMYFRSQKKLQNEVSINDTIDVDKDGNPLTYLDIISVEENIAEEIELKGFTDCLSDMVNRVLDERQRQIIILRYGLCGYQPRTQKEVARLLGISRSYVSRIEKRALELMREEFGDRVPEFDD